jgi:Na+/melibiose symporter-like transporter
LEKNKTNPEDLQRDGLSLRHIAAYSVGHVGNDLCASTWFFYLTWYLKTVVKVPDDLAGQAFLSG